MPILKRLNPRSGACNTVHGSSATTNDLAYFDLEGIFNQELHGEVRPMGSAWLSISDVGSFTLASKWAWKEAS